MPVAFCDIFKDIFEILLLELELPYGDAPIWIWIIYWAGSTADIPRGRAQKYLQ